MVGGYILAVNLPNELLKDAVWHLKQAKFYATDKSKIFELWHEIRSAVVFSITSVEAFFNMVASDHINKNPNLDLVTKGHLSEKQYYISKGDIK